MSLVQRGQEWSVRVDGRTLMSSRASNSEVALAEEALSRVETCHSILVGGLGLGYTLRAVLDQVSAQCAVSVSELVPALVDWNRVHLGHLASHPLEDSRVRVTVGDVFEHIKVSANTFDVILLDVDNGPVAFSDARNQRLYDRRGLVVCRRALLPGGILAVWSANASARFQRTLAAAGFQVEVLAVPAFKTGKATHFLFLGKTSSEAHDHAPRRHQRERTTTGKG